MDMQPRRCIAVAALSRWSTERLCTYGWAFELPEKFGSDILDFVKFGFLKMLLEICSEKSIPDISGTRNFGYPKFRVWVLVWVFPKYLTKNLSPTPSFASDCLLAGTKKKRSKWNKKKKETKDPLNPFRS